MKEKYNECAQTGDPVWRKTKQIKRLPSLRLRIFFQVQKLSG